MPYIKYSEKTFRESTMDVIEEAGTILDEYAEQGFDLTVRQLFYQFVSRGLIENTERSYKRIGTIINDARMTGLIDWNRIVDRTRMLRGLDHHRTPKHMIEDSVLNYHIDKWATQPNRVEVWIEKDALLGVVEGVCNDLDIDFFSCRGYTSQSEMWSAAQRLIDYQVNHGQIPVVLHFGDHDPSGIDMTRDITDRLHKFGARAVVMRVALTMGQIRKFDPPPNPTKVTDNRAQGYFEEFGEDANSWELDALEPSVITDLIESVVNELMVKEDWDEAKAIEMEGRAELSSKAESM